MWTTCLQLISDSGISIDDGRQAADSSASPGVDVGAVVALTRNDSRRRSWGVVDVDIPRQAATACTPVMIAGMRTGDTIQSSSAMPAT